MSSFLHSIRWRIQVWHGLILFIAITAFCLMAYHFAWDHQFRRIDSELQQTEHTLIRALMESGKPAADTPPAPTTPLEIARRLRNHEVTLDPQISALFGGTAYFRISDIDGHVLLQSSNVPSDVIPLPVPAAGFSEETRTIGLRRESLRSSAQGFSSVIGLNITGEQAEMHRFAWVLAASGLGVWLFGLLGGWWLAGRAIKPIAVISRTASHIAEGNLTERINTTGNDSELDQLSHVLNQTFERLHTAFERQKQFTSDASHELRTPVTILLAETQRSLKRDRTPEEYREVLRTCHATSERMRHLIEALLLLARQEASAPGPSHEPSALTSILETTIEHLRPLAAERGIVIETGLQAANCRGDSAALSILAANLIGNAIQHQRPGATGGTVRITSGYDEGQVFFSVMDNGPGISAEDLPHIFERFYRADKARTGHSGHTGLGLAIATTIAENHGGKINVLSTPGHGATFTVTLPAA